VIREGDLGRVALSVEWALPGGQSKNNDATSFRSVFLSSSRPSSNKCSQTNLVIQSCHCDFVSSFPRQSYFFGKSLERIECRNGEDSNLNDCILRSRTRHGQRCLSSTSNASGWVSGCSRHTRCGLVSQMLSTRLRFSILDHLVCHCSRSIWHSCCLAYDRT
jgi:hypothetical protein